ncbi:N-acetyltransferase [Lentzea sp. BCCO 10_0856]|uniref:N-acetyltransferase n=1 Tax=Lentzea miocenica TaxID=3095431 RepID=A0ABU4TAM0_9PSEU|nr:N-acetyltransferase [Lentzea sp. BCCO 10_0856]MDX8035223.1 N-acetyltransferase [Lentzea sp. BCCO 10_0856]
MTFVPDDFEVPRELTTESFRLEPLGNLADLRRHADDFDRRAGFTCSVLAADEVIGCVYIYPARDDHAVASVHSWVRADRADLDKPLYDVVSAWLADDWPFPEIRYVPRPRTGG